MAVVVICTALVFLWAVHQSGYDLENGFLLFAASREFYLVPFFRLDQVGDRRFPSGQVSFYLGRNLSSPCMLPGHCDILFKI